MAIQCFPHFPWAISLMRSTLGSSPEVQLKWLAFYATWVRLMPERAVSLESQRVLSSEKLPWSLHCHRIVSEGLNLVFIRRANFCCTTAKVRVGYIRNRSLHEIAADVGWPSFSAFLRARSHFQGIWQRRPIRETERGLAGELIASTAAALDNAPRIAEARFQNV